MNGVFNLSCTNKKILLKKSLYNTVIKKLKLKTKAVYIALIKTS